MSVYLYVCMCVCGRFDLCECTVDGSKTDDDNAAYRISKPM